jgi:Na+/H+ antiporter NhaC
VVSTSTGTSFGTIMVAGPLLYPAGGPLGADPIMLMGAILAGSTWGDSISPVSDTSIASAGSQHTDVPGTVRSRVKYVIPAGAVALVATIVLSAMRSPGLGTAALADAGGSPRALPMLIVPVIVIALLARRRHLLEGLLAGIAAALALGLVLGLIDARQVMHIDRASFGARGLVIDGFARGVGVSVFTLLLMGLVGGLQRAGVLERLSTSRRPVAAERRRTEFWIAGLASAAVMLTTHSVVAMLSVGAPVRELGARAGIPAYRRANLLDMTVCTWPFLLPFFLPTILASGASASGAAQGMPRVSPLAVGMANTYAWALVLVIPLAIVTGYGRNDAPPPSPGA